LSQELLVCIIIETFKVLTRNNKKLNLE